jgi:6-phosphogluconolactonase (cycloisomerase 2 family)
MLALAPTLTSSLYSIRPDHLVGHPTQNFLYALGTNQNDNLELQAFGVDAETGAASLLQALPHSIEVDPDGSFLYVWTSVYLWEELRLTVLPIKSDGRLGPASTYSSLATPTRLLFFEGSAAP